MGAYQLVQALINGLVLFATDLLLPFMIATFCGGIILKVLIHYTVKREYWFGNEFHKRVHRYINQSEEVKSDLSFFVVMRRLLEVTFYEVFEMRTIMKRRDPDAVMAVMDRVFLIQQGSARFVNDVLRQVRFLKYEREKPRLLAISKDVFADNPCFSRILGVVPIASINSFLNILPSLFIVGGIFGTFLGIMKALPELSGMDLANVEASKLVMDNFLLKISFSMSTSIIGIVLSVSMTIVNTFLSTEKLFVSSVERFEGDMSLLWDLCENNHLPINYSELEEGRDPAEALAEEAISRELQIVNSKFFQLSRPVRGWWLKSKAESPDGPVRESVSVSDNRSDQVGPSNTPPAVGSAEQKPPQSKTSRQAEQTVLVAEKKAAASEEESNAQQAVSETFEAKGHHVTVENKKADSDEDTKDVA